MSNHKNPGGLWPRIAAVGVMAGAILLATGCGGSSGSPDGSSSPGTSNVAKEVAYSNCMRAHGVKVSVGSNGSISTGNSGSGGGTSAQKMQSAQNACRHLLPSAPSGRQVQAHQAQALKQALKYTQCMRSHGMPNFPDPTTGNGPVSFPGVNGTSPGYAKANQACQSLLAGGGS